MISSRPLHLGCRFLDRVKCKCGQGGPEEDMRAGVHRRRSQADIRTLSESPLPLVAAVEPRNGALGVSA